MIDFASPPGSYRAALSPDGASCAACGQNECAHPDAVYQGLVPPLSGGDPRPDAGGLAPVPSFHASETTHVGQ